MAQTDFTTIEISCLHLTVVEPPSELAYEAAFYRYLLESEETTVEGFLAMGWRERGERAERERDTPLAWVLECRAACCGVRLG